jgi:hypothetical protein
MDRVFSFLPTSDLSAVATVSHAFKESVLTEDGIKFTYYFDNCKIQATFGHASVLTSLVN